MDKSLKKIWNVISSILVALVVFLALLLVGARVVGLQVFTVLSGSMEPTYHTGALIYVKKVDPYTITEGQPITFMLDENTVATHRVVGIVPDEEDPTVIRFRTKGDANDAEVRQLEPERVEDVDAVFNYDVPEENEYYVHRIGRTGRAKRHGVAYTLLSDFPSRMRLDDIVRNTRSQIVAAKLAEDGSVVAE